MRNVVILEDEAACMGAFRAILARGGYKPFCARTCCEVMLHMAGKDVDALVSDVFLCTQWCRGTDVALRAQRTHPAIKVLFVSGTAYGDWGETERRNVALLRESSWDILQKPFSAGTLLSCLGTLLTRPLSDMPAHAGCPHNRDCADLNPLGAGAPIKE